jgi:hypothetical protein
MSIREMDDFNAGVADGVLKERARILGLLDTYEAQSRLAVKAMVFEGVGDPMGVYAQLDMLRLLREVVQR